jgi:hypothetical protein
VNNSAEITPEECTWTLVRQGCPWPVFGEIATNKFVAMIPVMTSHADAVRFSRWIERDRESDKPVSPRRLLNGAVDVASLVGTNARPFVACITGWNGDGSPQWTLVYRAP